MQPISLLELNQLIGNAISSSLEPSYWIIAEIADLRINQKGHCYMELIHKSEDKILAKNRATVWAYEYRNLSFRFEQITGQSLKNGMSVMVNAIVKYHEIYGLSLNIRDIDPNFTLGERARRKKEILDRLAAEGLLEKNKRMSLPLVPQRVAVISSPTAAGYGDFIHQLEKNPYKYSFKTKLYNSILQGEEAVFSISESLNRINSHYQQFDLIVIIRGGGSQIDLDCFDSYELCRTIANSNLPVLTGIGHERDETIADLVAHTKLKTPSAVGEFLVDGMMNFEANLEELLYQIKYKYSDVLHRQEKQLDSFKYQLSRSLFERINGEMYKLETLKQKIQSSSNNLIANRNFNLLSLEAKVKNFDPLEVLKRGYTLSAIEGKIVKSKSDLPENIIETELETLGVDFRVKSIIKGIISNNDRKED